MDVQDQITHATSLSSGHEGHGVHLCHRCGWPFPNPHPSAKQRRSHKKHCGTIDGYTLLIGVEAVSDEDHHADTDKEKSPSPKIEKKMSIGGTDGGDGVRASISRSEDEFFSDAVTEFPDSGPSQGGSAKKSLDKDLFHSFNDSGNGGTNEVLNAPIEVSKVDASPEVTEKLVTVVEKIEETEITTPHALSESKLELTETDEKCADGLIKDGVVDPTPEPIHVSQSQEAETIEAVKAAEEKVEESQTSDNITEEAKDSEVTKMAPDVSTTVGQDADNIKQEVCEKIEPEVVKDSEINHNKIELDHEVAPEVVKESEIKPRVEVVVEEIKNEKIESDCELVPEVTKQSETDHKVSVSIKKEDLGEQIQEVVNKPDTVLTEKSDVDALESVKCSEEQIQEVVKEPDTVLTEKENPDAQDLKDEIQDSVKEPETIITEKENLEEPKLEKQSNECTQEVLVDPDSIWTEKTDLDAPILEKTSKENIPEEAVLKSDSVLTEKEDLDGPQLEKCAKENTHEVVEQKVENESNVVGLVADVTAEKITPNASGVAPEQMSVDSSSRNSIDANWGSVSVLSTASVDAESTEKPKVNPTKPVTADCLVEPEVKDSKQEPCPEDLTKVNNESEAKKSTPLKNLLGEAKSPSVNKTDHVAKKDEAVHDKEGDPMSPPKLIVDVKKGQKKFNTPGDIVKGVSSSDDNERLEATTFYCEQLSDRLSENTPPSKIPSTLVTQFVSFLDRKDFPALQIEAAKALANIACGTSAHRMLVIRHAVEKFVELLNSTENEFQDLREQAVCALGNVVVGDYKYRDMVLRKGALTALLPHAKQPAKPSMLQNVAWALSNLCSGKPHISLDQTKSALLVFQQLIPSNDEEVVMDACEALSYISDGPTDHIQAVIDASVFTNLVQLLKKNSSPSVLIPALNTVRKIASINRMLTQVLTQDIVNQEVLPYLRELLSNNHEENIRKGACRTISIIIASKKEELIQKVIEAKIIEPLVELLQNSELDTLEEAACAISNAIYYGSDTQIKHLVSCGCVKSLCHLLTCEEPTIVTLCLEGLENILKVGGHQKDSAESDVNPYVQMIEAEWIEQIKKLQNYNDANIHEIATVLVETYWVEKQDDGNATCEVDQPGFGGSLLISSSEVLMDSN